MIQERKNSVLKKNKTKKSFKFFDFFSEFFSSNFSSIAWTCEALSSSYSMLLGLLRTAKLIMNQERFRVPKRKINMRKFVSSHFFLSRKC